MLPLSPMPVRRRMIRYLKSRARGVGVFALLGAVTPFFTGRPPEQSEAGLAAWLGERAMGTVSAHDFVWEPRGNLTAELVFGRGIWFLGAESAGAPRDVYRARVRLTPGGQPLALRRLVNVTATPEADESGLLLQAGRLAFASVARGHVGAVSVIDQRRAAGSALTRAVAAATKGGAFERTDVLLDAAASSAALTLDEHSLRLELAELAEHVAYDLERRAFSGEAHDLAHALAEPAGEGSVALEWTALSRTWLGLEATALGGRSLLRAWELGRRVLGESAGVETATAKPSFVALSHAWLKPPLGTDAKASAPERYFSRATWHPASHPSATLELVALDTRQLEVGYAAGSAWPRATLGAPGEGRLPREAARYRRVVAVFNGGPESAYERYGAMSDGRLLAAPSERAPSFVQTRSQRATLGPWTAGADVPLDVSGFTQRRSALVAAGVAVPSSDTSVRRRTAICALDDGRLVYAYATGLDASGLGGALASAGCEYALPLAGTPERLGFALADVASPTAGRFELVAPGMDLDARATLGGSTREFFYVSVRDMTPKLPPGVVWSSDGGTQPAPAWLPGMLHGELTLGGVTLSLASFELGRLELRVRPGSLEPGARGQAWSGALAADDAARALAVLELGHATGSNRFGLALGRVIPLPLRPSNATLVVGSGTARILLPGEPVTLADGEHAVQLPLLADDSDVTERARERGDARPRSALGVTEDGRLVVATLRHDSSDPLAVGLRAAGCRRIVELDRGSHHPAALERAGSEKPPRTEPASTTLWLLGRR